MENLPINIVDIILLALAVISGLLATLRGFVREVLSIAAWIGAMAASLYGNEPLRPYIEQYTQTELLVTGIAWIGPFLVTLVILSFVSHAISKGVKDSAVGALDRSLGFLFGVARVIFLACILLYGTASWYKDEPLPDIVTQARSYPYIEKATRNILSLLPESYRTDLNQTGNSIRDQIDAANEAKRQLDKLNKLRPAGDQENNQEPAYSDDQRSNMNDLIQDNQ